MKYTEQDWNMRKGVNVQEKGMVSVHNHLCWPVGLAGGLQPLSLAALLENDPWLHAWMFRYAHSHTYTPHIFEPQRAWSIQVTFSTVVYVSQESWRGLWTLKRPHTPLHAGSSPIYHWVKHLECHPALFLMKPRGNLSGFPYKGPNWTSATSHLNACWLEPFD